jgi:lipopolysaccharide transport system permease protein
MDQPQECTIIKAGSRAVFQQLGEIAKARYMLWNMIKSSALLPYQEFVFGAFWACLRPIIFVLVIVFIRSKSNAQMGETIPYPLYVFSGLILWWYFVDATKQSSRSLYRYRSLLTKIYYPRVITPIIPVVARLFELVLQAVVLVPMMFYFKMFPGVDFLLLPLVLLNVMLLCLGLGYLFAVLSAVVKDFERVLDFTLYLAFFLSPVIYSASLLPDHHQMLYFFLNPMAGPLEAFRGILFTGGRIEYSTWLCSATTTLGIFLAGSWAFLKNEERLAELVS